MLTLSGIRKSFGGLPVLDGIDLTVAGDEIVALLGPSGCGKTTLLNIVAGFIRQDAGRMALGNTRVGYLFQEDRLLPWLTVRDNIRIVGDPRNAGEIDGLIDLVGLGGFAGYYPGSLSGGMRQRCALARAYHYRCDLLLMDEPFKSLDHGLRLDMLAALMAIRGRRRNSVLFITHDVDEALAVASRAVVLGRRPTRVVGEYALGPTETPRRDAAGRFADVRGAILAALA